MSVSPEIRKYFSKLGKKGGRTRGEKYSKEQLSAWAKKGGRPMGKNDKKVDGKDTQSSSA